MLNRRRSALNIQVDLVGGMLFNGWTYLVVFIVACMVWGAASVILLGSPTSALDIGWLLLIFGILIGLIILGAAIAAIFGVFRGSNAREFLRSLASQQEEATKLGTEVD